MPNRIDSDITHTVQDKTMEEFSRNTIRQTHVDPDSLVFPFTVGPLVIGGIFGAITGVPGGDRVFAAAVDALVGAGSGLGLHYLIVEGEQIIADAEAILKGMELYCLSKLPKQEIENQQALYDLREAGILGYR